MIIGRVLGWIFIVASLAVLLLDFVVSFQAGYWTPTAISRVWSDLDPSSLEIIRGYGSRVLGDAIVSAFFRFWSVPALIAVGVLLLIVFSRPINRI